MLRMRLLWGVILALVCLIQYPLWLGKGGWLKVWELQRQVALQHHSNAGMRARNIALEAEVWDLQTGVGALEERARSELGMMKKTEIFVQIIPQAAAPARGAAVEPPKKEVGSMVRSARAAGMGVEKR